MCSRFVFFVGSIVRSFPSWLTRIHNVFAFCLLFRRLKTLKTLWKRRKRSYGNLPNFEWKTFFFPFFFLKTILILVTFVHRFSNRLSHCRETKSVQCHRFAIEPHRQRNNGGTTSSFALGYIHTAADDGHVMPSAAHIYQKSNTVNHMFFFCFILFAQTLRNQSIIIVLLNGNPITYGKGNNNKTESYHEEVMVNCAHQ